MKNSFYVAVIGLTFAIWPIAFNFGVYHTVLAPHLFSILAASIAILLSNLMFRRAEAEWFSSRLLVNCILLLPTLWLVAEILLHGNESTISYLLRILMTVATILIALPYIIYFIVMRIIPGMEAITEKKDKVKLAVIVAVVAGLGYITGEFHQYVISCNDFELAGIAIPGDCWDAVSE